MYQFAGRGSPRFVTTNWQLIEAARTGEVLDAEEALNQLCQIYWQPVYAFISRWGSFRGQSPEDLTQSFFLQLLAHNDLARVSPAKGRFRSFLKQACRNFLLNERQRQRRDPIGWGMDHGEKEPSHHQTPEKEFDRAWTLGLLDRCLARLDEEHRDTRNLEKHRDTPVLSASPDPAATRDTGDLEKHRDTRNLLYHRLKPHLTGDPSSEKYDQIAGSLAMTPAAVKQACYRLRLRFQSILRAEVALTVGDAAEVDEEILELFRSLEP
jgi:RNA polymerase sigma factor (sigma-70 family)